MIIQQLDCVKESGLFDTRNRQVVEEIRPVAPADWCQFLPLDLTNFAAMPATTAETLSLVTRTVSVAPLVLLSAADHYGRTATGSKRRVVGVLLGQNDGKNVRVSNSFAGMFILEALQN